MKQLTTKQIFKNFNWTVKIETQWQDKKIKETLKLPQHKRELVEKIVDDYIKTGKTMVEKIYTSQSGSDFTNLETLLKTVASFKKKHIGKMRPYINSYNKFPVRIYVENDGNYDYVALECCVEYDKETLLEYAKGDFDRIAGQYKRDYETMLLTSKTLEHVTLR